MDDSRYNSMQAHMGILPGLPSPMEQHPALAMAQEASRRSIEAMAATRMMSSPVAMFGQQFQQQYSAITSQQSMSPYTAQALSQYLPGSPGYSPQYLPSPLLMTPPSTGMFRPPMPPAFAPIPPMPFQPLVQTPFTPRPTSPMFQTPYQQAVALQQQRSSQMFSYGSQIPRFAGEMGASYAGGAIGAAIGSAIMPGVGTAVGALAGSLLTDLSGGSRAAGNITQFPFGSLGEIQTMGGAIGRMSQDWVVGGPQAGPLGRGFSQEAGLGLAQGISSLASNRGFQRETGGMFNRQDLTRMLGMAGSAGLMDQEQGIDGVRNNLRQVSRVVRRFMELTNDPDMSNVIRQMGQMSQFGMKIQDMEMAARNMSLYSRAAATTIGGIAQMGGLPGSMTFAQAGLTPAAGFQYGMYAQASARQLYASGGISTQQLALMGGVSGMAQRDIQAQAAMMSMPLMGAAVGSFGSGGWGMNAGNLSMMQQGGVGGTGAAGMVLGAVGNIGQAVRQGGIGALAMLPLQMREMQSKAMESMSPEQADLMRFQMAMRTGKFFGMKGEQALAMGAQQLFGQEVAEQDLMVWRNPEHFAASARNIRRKRQEGAYDESQRTLGASWGVLAPLQRSLYGVSDAFNAWSEREQGSLIGGLQGVTNWFGDANERRRGLNVFRTPREFLSTREERAGLQSFDTARLAASGKRNPGDFTAAETLTVAEGIGRTGFSRETAGSLLWFLPTAITDSLLAQRLSGAGFRPTEAQARSVAATGRASLRLFSAMDQAQADAQSGKMGVYQAAVSSLNGITKGTNGATVIANAASNLVATLNSKGTSGARMRGEDVSPEGMEVHAKESLHQALKEDSGMTPAEADAALAQVDDKTLGQIVFRAKQTLTGSTNADLIERSRQKAGEEAGLSERTARLTYKQLRGDISDTLKSFGRATEVVTSGFGGHQSIMTTGGISALAEKGLKGIVDLAIKSGLGQSGSVVYSVAASLRGGAGDKSIRDAGFEEWKKLRTPGQKTDKDTYLAEVTHAQDVMGGHPDDVAALREAGGLVTGHAGGWGNIEKLTSQLATGKLAALHEAGLKRLGAEGGDTVQDVTSVEGLVASLRAAGSGLNAQGASLLKAYDAAKDKTAAGKKLKATIENIAEQEEKTTTPMAGEGGTSDDEQRLLETQIQVFQDFAKAVATFGKIVDEPSTAALLKKAHAHGKWDEGE